MIPPIWNRNCCNKCKSTDIDDFGFCNNCGEPVVFSPGAEFKVSFAISKWTADFPDDQQHRCMVCGRRGEFLVSLREGDLRKKMALLFITRQKKYQSLATYWKGDPPKTLAQALINKRERSLHEVENLPEELTELREYADPPIMCLHCMSSFSLEKEEKKKAVKPPDFKVDVQLHSKPTPSPSSKPKVEFGENFFKNF